MERVPHVTQNCLGHERASRIYHRCLSHTWSAADLSAFEHGPLDSLGWGGLRGHFAHERPADIQRSSSPLSRASLELRASDCVDRNGRKKRPRNRRHKRSLGTASIQPASWAFRARTTATSTPSLPGPPFQAIKIWRVGGAGTFSSPGSWSLDGAESLTRSAQRLLLSRQSLAQEFSEGDISPLFAPMARPIRTTSLTSAMQKQASRTGSWKLPGWSTHH